MGLFQTVVDATQNTSTTANYVNFPSLTQTEINALVGESVNSVVFNSTLGKLQIYNGSGWDSFAVGAVVTPTVVSVSTNTACSVGVIYQADATGGSITLTLPTAVGVSGQSLSITKIDSSANTIVVATTGGQTINGQLTTEIAFQNSFFSFTSNGSNWIIN